jgi:hypothetical protein
LVPTVHREHVLGDLLERYESPARYLREALRTLPYLFLSRLRRTTHPLGLFIVGGFLVAGRVSTATAQESGLVALIPTLLTLVTLMLRDIYRAPKVCWPRAALTDVAIAAVLVLLLQAGPELRGSGMGADA